MKMHRTILYVPFAGAVYALVLHGRACTRHAEAVQDALGKNAAGFGHAYESACKAYADVFTAMGDAVTAFGATTVGFVVIIAGCVIAKVVSNA